MNSDLTPFRIQKYLAGLRYPATKTQVIERARVLAADEAVLDVLLRLAERTYDSPISVACAIGHPRPARA